MAEDQLVRQWKILRILQASKQGVSVAAMSEKVQHSKRGIYRDLSTLLNCGFPIYSEKAENRTVWKHLDVNKFNFTLPINLTELMALHLGKDVLRVFQGTVFYESMVSFLDKVTSALPPNTGEYLAELSRTINAGFSSFKNYDAVRDVINKISDAATGQKRVEIVYVAASTKLETIRKVDPYHIWVMDARLYLIGHCHLRNSARTFAMDRIRRVTVLSEKFERLTDSSVIHRKESAFRVMSGEPEDIRIRISSSAAYTVKERQWHSSQQTRELKNGSVVVTLKVPINYEIISWIMGYGASAVVLEPVSLRARIIREMKDSLKRYHVGRHGGSRSH